MVIEKGAPLLASDMLDLTFFPIGTILMYDGTNWVNGRGGWYICDGQNGTPDLRDRFIKCRGSAPDIDGSNALTSAMLPQHTHGLSGGNAASGGSHGHEFYGGIRRSHIYTDPAGQDKYILWNRWYADVDFTGASAHGDSEILVKLTATHAVQQGGAHTHSLSGSTDNNSGLAGAAANYNNMPSYYSVIYIKKMTGNNM
jgi:hypothetical protein